MKFEDLKKELAERMRSKLAEELGGILWAHWEGDVLTVAGECRKVHPSNAGRYPNGWCFSQDYNMDGVLSHLGLDLELREQTTDGTPLLQDSERDRKAFMDELDLALDNFRTEVDRTTKFYLLTNRLPRT